MDGKQQLAEFIGQIGRRARRGSGTANGPKLTILFA